MAHWSHHAQHRGTETEADSQVSTQAYSAHLCSLSKEVKRVTHTIYIVSLWLWMGVILLTYLYVRRMNLHSNSQVHFGAVRLSGKSSWHPCSAVQCPGHSFDTCGPSQSAWVHGWLHFHSSFLLMHTLGGSKEWSLPPTKDLDGVSDSSFGLTQPQVLGEWEKGKSICLPFRSIFKNLKCKHYFLHFNLLHELGEHFLELTLT